MANYAYLSLWLREFEIVKGLSHLQTLLSLFPRSHLRADFHLRVRSIDQAQPPSLERELLASPAVVGELATQFLHNDTAYEVTGYWDLWRAYPSGGTSLAWEREPSPVEFTLLGEKFDAGAFRQNGHLLVNLGFEHLYTGHAGILRGAEPRPEEFTNRAEFEFVFALQDPEVLQEYRRRTQENIRQLKQYQAGAERHLPVENIHLWSEGEIHFAECLEEVLQS